MITRHRKKTESKPQEEELFTMENVQGVRRKKGSNVRGLERRYGIPWIPIL